MKSGITLKALAERLEENAAAKKDFVTDTRTMTMVSGNPVAEPVREGGDFARLMQQEVSSESAEPMLQIEGQDILRMTDHCHRQLASWSGIGTRYYDKMREDSHALLLENVNHWLHKKPADGEVRRMVRSMDGVARAFLSDVFLRLDNEHVAEATFRALDGIDDLSMLSCEVTDQRLYLKFAFPRTQLDVAVGDAVQSGVIVRNSEIGLGSFDVFPFIYSLVCLNGMTRMVKGSGVKRRHVGKRIQESGVIYKQDTIEAAAQAALLECRDAVTTFADPEFFAKQVGDLRAAAETEAVEKPVRAVEVMAKAKGFDFTEGEQESILERFIRKGDYSKYGMLNAVTNLANDVESYDRASELEVLGGKVLDLNTTQWHEIAKAA